MTSDHPAPDDAYDVVVIGAGQAGPPLANALAAAGRRVALVERKHVGGSCVNFGCTPTKAALASARLAHMARRGAEFGVAINTIQVNFGAVIARARGLAEQARFGLDNSLDGPDNPKLIRGHARLWGREGDRFRVRMDDGRVFTASEVVINTGTRAAIPAIPGLGVIEYWTADSWLELDRLPSRLVILGAGPVGVEFAQFYRRMGAEVVLVARDGLPLPGEDADVSEGVKAILVADGVEVRCGGEVALIERSDAGIVLTLKDGSTIEGSDLLVATGRQANTDDLGLDTLELAPSGLGIVDADATLRTAVPGLWIAGDARGGQQLTSTAWDDHRILLSQMTGDGARTCERISPYAIFTDPELGRVGLSERQAREDGVPFKVGTFDMSRIAKAREDGEAAGFIKLLTDPGGGALLGAAILGIGGAELIHLCALLIQAKLPPAMISDGVFAHPTLAEGLQSAFSAALS